MTKNQIEILNAIQETTNVLGLTEALQVQIDDLRNHSLSYCAQQAVRNQSELDCAIELFCFYSDQCIDNAVAEHEIHKSIIVEV